jgi:hemerythrin
MNNPTPTNSRHKSPTVEWMESQGYTPNVAHRANTLYEQIIKNLDELIREATTLRAKVTQENRGVAASYIMQHAYHAGYSNSIHTMSAEITAHCAQFVGMLEAKH